MCSFFFAESPKLKLCAALLLCSFLFCVVTRSSNSSTITEKYYYGMTRLLLSNQTSSSNLNRRTRVAASCKTRIMCVRTSNSSNSNTFYNNHSRRTGGVDGDDQCNARRSMFVLYLPSTPEKKTEREREREKLVDGEREREHSNSFAHTFPIFLLLVQQPRTQLLLSSL